MMLALIHFETLQTTATWLEMAATQNNFFELIISWTPEVNMYVCEYALVHVELTETNT